ncbi:hypothetical protein H4Q26_015512 [Puccinia striiformis f. sp. tritici PST-130]|nr:hypothetical protein H4Q26_015512 [Puccinia striiformis f. sp. tritici PST-130]
MQTSLAELLCKAVGELSVSYTKSKILDKERFLAWIKSYPAHLVVVAVQIMWTQTIDNTLQSRVSLTVSLQTGLQTLDIILFVVLGELNPVMRSKCKTESVKALGIQSILQGLKAASVYPNAEIKLVGKTLKINPHAGIFITMHPGYAGQSNLPNNLKKRFRSMVMTRPDGELITQVMLFSQGFRTAEILASKVVPFFSLCDEKLSKQPHYDFGLRALKAVLTSTGHLKRACSLQNQNLDDTPDQLSDSYDSIAEQEILVQSVSKTIVSKLVADNVPLLTSLLADIFQELNIVQYVPESFTTLSDPNIQHGLMMGGPLATSKTQAWRVLLAVLQRLKGCKGVSYVMDPKAISKDALYDAKRHWIIFDGDTDPEWVKNLNSVLDDNKLLTLPNGERLNLLNNENYLKTTPDVALEVVAKNILMEPTTREPNNPKEISQNC